MSEFVWREQPANYWVATIDDAIVGYVYREDDSWNATTCVFLQTEAQCGIPSRSEAVAFVEERVSRKPVE